MPARRAASPILNLDQECSVNGPRTRNWVLQAEDCLELASHHIARIGLESAWSPYQRVRLRPGGSFFLACLEGEGRILLEGKWQSVAAGSLCMAPPRVLNAFHAVSGKPWVFAWVRYDEGPHVKPLVGAASPLWLKKGAEQFGRVVAGLKDEWENGNDPIQIHHWIALVHSLALRMAQPWQTGARIGKLWEIVSRELATDWKLTTLARKCALSPEHLRRLCLREIGRTPMEHVAYMRIQRAQDILETSDEKLEAVAPQVGYKSAHVFSRAFVRFVGMTPTAYRACRMAGRAPAPS